MAIPYIILIVSSVFAIISSIIGYFVKDLLSKQKDMEKEISSIRTENLALKGMIDQNGQRDKLIEQFYDKTVGIELRNIEKTLTKLEQKFEKYIDGQTIIKAH